MPDLNWAVHYGKESISALRQWLRWDAKGNWVPTEAEREQQQKS